MGVGSVEVVVDMGGNAVLSTIELEILKDRDFLTQKRAVLQKISSVLGLVEVRLKASVGKKAILKNLYFNFGSSELSDGSERILTILLQLLIDHQDLQVEIAGHTDNLGDDNFNLWLSRKRANVIYSQLVSQGVEGTRLLAKGYGETQPIASNDDENEGRSLNRRIEIMVIE